MKRLLVLLAVAAVWTGDLSGQTIRDLVGAHFEARVIAITDGDTLDAVPAGEKRAIRLRLEGIDTPERGEPFSLEARNFIRVLLFGQTVRAEGRDVDRYGRLVARVRIGDTDASLELLSAGLACHYTAYSSDPTLAGAQNQARLASRGFWALGAAKPRCIAAPQVPARAKDTSTRTQPQTNDAFHGNAVSRVYHAPYCRNFNCPNCKRLFASEEEAKKAGFRPAGDCLGQR